MHDDSTRDDELRALLVDLRPAFSSILARYGIPPHDAEDRVQDAVICFLAKRKQIRNPAAWLREAVKNECRMYCRTRSRSRVVAVDQAILDLVAEDVGPAQEKSVLRRSLKRWIGQLDRRCQELLHLRYILGLEPREVAERTRYKPSSIDKVIRRCVDALARKASALTARRQQRRDDTSAPLHPGGADADGEGAVEDDTEEPRS